MTTSQTAYEEIKPKIPNHHANILKLMNILTDKGIAEFTSKDLHTYFKLKYVEGVCYTSVEISRRTSELERLGKIEVCGRNTFQNCNKYKLIKQP